MVSQKEVPERSAGAVPLELHASLMDYGNYILNGVKPPVMDTQQLEDKEAKKALVGLHSWANTCVSPMAAVRGWSLLAMAAEGKTKKSLEDSVAIMAGKTTGHLNCPPSMAGRGVVRLFFEYPAEVLPNESRMADMQAEFGDTMGVPGKTPLVRTCFTCDHDGSRSMQVINNEFKKSTGDRIRYVVREEDAPDRRAVAVLVSASDCTFEWMHGSMMSPAPMYFYSKPGKEEASKTTVNAWKVDGTYNFVIKGDEKAILLESPKKDVKLLLFTIAKDRPVEGADEVTRILQAIPTVAKRSIICIPEFSVATPLRLRECSTMGKYATPRVFDREKSVLSGFLDRFSPFSSNLTTLWDHYHKTLFTIVDSQTKVNTDAEKTLRLLVGFESRVRDNQSSWIFNSDTERQSRKYHEERLLGLKHMNKDRSTRDMAGDFVLDTPFHFVLLHYLDNRPVVQCMGRFNNVDAIVTSIKEKKEVDLTLPKKNLNSPPDSV